MTIYLHQKKDGSQKRLIRSTHPSKAMSFVSKKDHTCEAASVDTVVELMQKGVLIEDADEKVQTGDLFSNGSGTAYADAGGE